MKIVSYIHAILTIALAVFFVQKGYEKFGEPKLREKHIKTENTDAIVNQVIVNKDYSAPYGYDLTMNTFRQSGFIRIIGLFQILAGLLMLYPKTRMAGLLTLLPIILNIFLMHLFFDNRQHENVETGIILAYTVLMLLYYWKQLGRIAWLKKEPIAVQA